jgi:hypothetical protein
MEEQTNTLPAEVAQIAQSVSAEKRNEVQSVLNHVFAGVSKMRAQLDAVVVADETDKVNMKLANTIRLGVRQVRLDAEKVFDAKRVEVQALMISYKTEDQLWLKAKQTMQLLTKEIEEQARWKEETKERYDAEQKELKAQQRMVQVQKFNPEIPRNDFENMADETFTVFLSGLEKAYNDKIEAARIAEEQRIAKEKADAEERERVRLENERLKAEAEAKEKQLAAERAKAAAEKAAAEEQARKEREAIEAKAAEEKRIADANLKAEREAKEKLEAEIKAKADAEAKAKREAEAQAAAELKAKQAADAKAAKAPKKQKLSAWINSMSAVAPVGLEQDQTAVEILEKFEAFKKWAAAKVESL